MATGSKTDHERDAFDEFAKSAGLAVEAGSVGGGDPDKAEPDISYRIAGQPQWFELGRILPEEIPQFTTKAIKQLLSGAPQTAGGAVTGPGKVLVRIIEQKAGKHYQTAGAPVDLVLYFDNSDPKTWGFPPPGDFQVWADAYMVPTIAKSAGQFAQVWVYDRNKQRVLWRWAVKTFTR